LPPELLAEPLPDVPDAPPEPPPDPPPELAPELPPVEPLPELPPEPVSVLLPEPPPEWPPESLPVELAAEPLPDPTPDELSVPPAVEEDPHPMVEKGAPQTSPTETQKIHRIDIVILARNSVFEAQAGFRV